MYIDQEENYTDDEFKQMYGIDNNQMPSINNQSYSTNPYSNQRIVNPYNQNIYQY